MTDKQEANEKQWCCCKLPELRAADSTCISSTQYLHELYAYQHKLEAIYLPTTTETCKL